MYAVGSAKDMPSAGVTDWSGLYLGGHVGAADMYSGIADLDGTLFDQEGLTASRSHLKAIYGLQGGYGIQFGSAYLGIEADYAFTNAESGGLFDGTDHYYRAEWHGMGTVRARLGLAHENALVYATGGFAFVDLEQVGGDDFLDAPADQTQVVEFSDSRSGIAAGAGVEIMLTDFISVKGEYLYIGLEEDAVRCADCDDDAIADGEAHLVRVGVNYRFGAGLGGVK